MPDEKDVMRRSLPVSLGKLKAILLFLFVAYLVAPGLERTFYLNELLALCGFVIFLKVRYSPPTRASRSILTGVQLYIVVGCTQLVISPLLYEINTYGYLRNSQMVYSAFSFFLGVFLFDTLQNERLWNRAAYITVLTLNLVSILSLAYLSTILMAGVAYKRGRPAVLFLLFTALFCASNWSALSNPTTSGATWVVYIGLVSIIFVMFTVAPLHRVSNLLITVILSALIAVYAAVAPLSEVLLEEDFTSYQVSLREVIPMEDPNIDWRLGLWTVLLTESAQDLPLGIGMGVGLFPEGLEDKISLRAYEDPHFAYTVGAHNSFLTVFLRMGVLGIGAIACMYWGYVKTLVPYVRQWVRGRDMLRFATALGVLVVTMHASVHVVIESPLYATSFWGAWGLFYKAIATDPRLQSETTGSQHTIAPVQPVSR